MDYQDFRRRLRVAAAAGDSAAITAELANTMPDNALQIVGQALLVALENDDSDAEPVARRCIAALAQRQGPGDDILAGQLDAALEHRAPPKPVVAVDLEDLGDALNGPPGDDPGVLDIETGEFLPPLPFGLDDLSEEGPAEPDGVRTLAVWPEGSHDAHRDMQDFIATIVVANFADQLSNAIHGRSPFRRFRDVLDRRQDLFSRWQTFSDDRRIGRAREWLDHAGHHAAPQPRRTWQ